MSNQKLTRRQKWIIDIMTRHGGLIYENWDSSQEASRWQLEWDQYDSTSVSGRRFMASEVTEKMRCNLIDLKLIEEVDRQAKKTKGGKFITSESVYGLVKSEAQ